MTNQQYIQNIRDFIAKDDLTKAIAGLRGLLDNTPQLDVVLQQSGRFENIRKQIRLGTVSHFEANLTKNQIRAGLLELVSEIEHQNKTPTIRAEIERVVSIVNSKNILVNSPITAGGDVHIVDQSIHTESKTSRRLRLFLYLFVPFLALSTAFLWYRLQPVSLTVAVQYRPANPDLAFEKGEITLHPGGKPKEITKEKEAIFTDIRRGERVILHFEADGFVPIDTTFVPSGTQLILPIRRNNSLARVFGTVRNGQGKALGGITILVQQDLTTQTLPDGSFSLPVPPEKQHRNQRVQVLVNEKVVWDYTQPIMADSGIEIQL